MRRELQVIVCYKSFLNDLIESVEYIPRKEKIVKDLFLKDAFELLKRIYFVNGKQEKKEEKETLLTSLSVLDYYLEYFYSKNELSKKIVERKSYELLVVRKIICAWLR